MEAAINSALSELASFSQEDGALDHLIGLQNAQAAMMSRIDALYISLDVQTVPELNGLPPDFVRVLFAARDLKMNIRKRAHGTFMEWDRLDQAASGRNIPLGRFCLFRLQ